MCGVIGYSPGAYVDHDAAATLFERILMESRVRGLHSVGVAHPGRLVRSHTVSDVIAAFDPRRPAVAHCRFSTSGDWRVLSNCQPIVVGEMSLAFNGVIHMGTKTEFEKEFDVVCESDNDGEIFLRLLERGIDAQTLLSTMSGSFAGVWLVDDVLHAARNSRRPLWMSKAHGAVWFASTRDIFKRAGVTDVCKVSADSIVIRS